MTEEFCSLSVEELQRLRVKVERLLEQFDQDWAIFEKSYVQELMTIEADARKTVIEAIFICKQMCEFEHEQRRKGKIFFSQSDDYNNLRSKLLVEISQINAVANLIGQGRDDLDVSVLIAADEIIRTVSSSQSSAVRQLADKILRSFNKIRQLFQERYAANVEVVDP